MNSAQVFEMTPTSPALMWVIGAICLIPIAIGAWLLWNSLGMGRAQFEISSAGLRVNGEYARGRVFAWNQLKLEAARVVDLTATNALQPVMRTWGTGLPGYSAGWFTLRNREKALVYLSARDQVLYLPTTENFVLLLSTPRAQELLEALRTARPI
jgi:hypothetical protein